MYKEKKYIKIIFIVYIIMFMGLSIKLYFLQIEPSTMVQGEVTNQQIENISNSKYKILDADGKDLLNYKKRYVLVIDSRPFQLNNYEHNIEDLLALNFIMTSENSKFSYDSIITEIGKHYYDITEETYNKINKLKNVKGIYTYVLNEVNGKEGWRIENYIANIKDKDVKEDSFEKEISNIVKDNKYPSESFFLNQEAIYDRRLSEETNNNNIKLTIDKEVEDKVREVLSNESYSFLKNIGVVLLESDTGKIRAMVQKDESAANVNLGIGSLGFEPGSIFKLITEATALDLGKIDVSTVFECDGNICTKLGKTYAHGPLTVEQAIEVSCNDVFAQVGSLVGYDEMINYTSKLGLYKRVLGLSTEGKEEAAGVMPTIKKGISNFSIGQCVTVTPLQIAGAINTIVNDGVYIKPTIIDSVLDSNNNVVYTPQKIEENVFSETAAKIVQNSMSDVIWYGSGFEAKVEGVNVGGKTGTSTGEGGSTNHGWFAGYFELDNKKYTLVVVAPNIGDKHPDGRELGGGNTGAPIFRDIINSLAESKEILISK